MSAYSATETQPIESLTDALKRVVLRLFFDPVGFIVSKEKPVKTQYRRSQGIIGLTPVKRQLDFGSGISGCWDDSTELSQVFHSFKTKNFLGIFMRQRWLNFFDLSQ